MSASLTARLQARDFWRASRGFYLVWLVHLGRRYRLLDALAHAKGSLSPAALARASGADVLAVRLWCDAAVALKLLKARGGKVHLARQLVPLLVDADDPRYLAGHLSYLALRSLDFDAFDPLFREGRVQAPSQRHLVEAFGEATRFDHTAFLNIVLPRVPPLRRRLATGCDILDVGAGAGTWEMRVAPRFPNCSFVGVEPQREARRRAHVEARRKKMAPRVQFVPGRAETMRFEGRFDVVYLGEMLCAARDAPRVLSRCRRALRAGGTLVVCEGLRDDAAAPTGPANAILLSMQLEFALQPARFFTKRELQSLVEAAGFEKVRFVGAGGGLWFLVAAR
jgi:ubiquinone/menaquinone biosynthesis C-methylase UbiE